MFQVIVINDFKWYLRGTTWTSDKRRADKFPTASAAQQAFDNAKKFMRTNMRKLAKIVPVTEDA